MCDFHSATDATAKGICICRIDYLFGKRSGVFACDGQVESQGGIDSGLCRQKLSESEVQSGEEIVVDPHRFRLSRRFETAPLE